ncbi:MAG: hypothetical protein WBI41_06430 [Azovibrio sp.]|uniref:hypothetical protein n=1 Tax=Azovibrio sp. TaxID=1872673 RepID=UPI003C77E630
MKIRSGGQVSSPDQGRVCPEFVVHTVTLLDVLAPVCRAIHARRPVAIRHHSMSSAASGRTIVPSARVDTGVCWHVRAFDPRSTAPRGRCRLDAARTGAECD